MKTAGLIDSSEVKSEISLLVLVDILVLVTDRNEIKE